MKKALAFVAIAVLFVISASADTAKTFDVFDTPAIYSDGSTLYCYPQSPTDNESVTVKLRVRKDNVTEVFVYFGESVLPMVKLASQGSYDYYFAEIPPRRALTGYYFEIRQNKKTVWYSRRGMEFKPPVLSYQFKIIPNYSVPEWMKGAVLYQIYIDRFANGNPSNDVVTNEYMYDNWPAVKVEDWNQLPDAARSYATGSDRTREFYGGDIDGIIQKLDYLKDLGIDGIYLNPIFVSPSNHKYDAQDYEHIDPHVGVIVKDGGALIDPKKDPNYESPNFVSASTVNKNATKYSIRTTSLENLAASDAKFKELVDKAHAKGIRIILDGVFNHSGSFNRWFDREHVYPADQGPGAYETKDSPFVAYYKFAGNAWPNNETYDAWYGFKTLPKLNFEASTELTSKVMDLGAKWVGPSFGADGWRLDVAADLGYSSKFNHQFWQLFRDSVKAANPEAVILAEVYGDSSSWLMGNEWDTVMNYDAFFEPVGWFLTGLEKHSYYYRADLHNNADNFAKDLSEKMAKLPYVSLETAMNELDNHDHSRFLTRTSGYVDDTRPTADLSPQALAGKDTNKGILKEATVLQMSMPGAPTLYYGDEAGLAGFTDPDSRRTYPWGNEDQELLSFFKDAIAVHKAYSALKTGSYLSLYSKDKGVFALGRWDRASRAVAAINNNSVAKTFDVPVDKMGMKNGEKLKLVLLSDKDTHSSPGKEFGVSNGKIKVELPAYGAAILAAATGADDPAPAVTKRPTVKAVFPAKGASGADPNGVIRIEYSEPMSQRDIIGAFSISPPVAGKFTWNGNRVTFKSAAPLAAGTYTVRIEPTVAALNGGFRPAAETSWSFTVK